jgi:hypothetical protein
VVRHDHHVSYLTCHIASHVGVDTAELGCRDLVEVRVELSQLVRTEHPREGVIDGLPPPPGSPDEDVPPSEDDEGDAEDDRHANSFMSQSVIGGHFSCEESGGDPR